MRNRHEIQKEFIRQLRETGNVISTCYKVKVPRSTIYRWRLDDDEFLKEFEDAQEEGRFVMSSIAESVVISNIRDKSQRAAEFYLRHNSTQYRTKPRLSYEELLPLSDRRWLSLLTIINYAKKLKKSNKTAIDLKYHNEQIRKKRRQ